MKQSMQLVFKVNVTQRNMQGVAFYGKAQNE